MERFNVGWNDTAHGILTWTDGCCPYPSVLAWALEMKKVAIETKPHAKDGSYFDGVIACVDHYQKTGCMERKS